MPPINLFKVWEKPSLKTLFHALVLLNVFLFSFLAIFSLFPPIIVVQKFNTYEVDQKFAASVWGIAKHTKVTVTTKPSEALNIKTSNNLNPFTKYIEVTPTDLFKPETSYEITYTAKNWLGVQSRRKVSFTTQSLPKVLSSNPAHQKEISPKANITFKVDKIVSGGNFSVSSEPSFPYKMSRSGNAITVVPQEKLMQGTQYNIALHLIAPSFGTKELYKATYSVIEPLILTSSSPANDQQAVAKQTSFTFNFNKPVEKVTFEKGFSLSPSVEGTLTWKDEQTVEFVPNTPLKTQTNYEISLSETISGHDNSELQENIKIPFTTAGIVKVTSFSPTGTGVSVTTNIAVTFDQPVEETYAQKAFSISPSVSGTFSFSGTTLNFKPNNLSRLTTYKIKLSPGIKSIGGEDSQQEFTSEFTTTGEQVKTIGYSVAGRPINAYYFGTGQKKILLVGTLHGSEVNTGNMLSQWIAYLRANQDAIPSDRSFVIVPYANPDGRVRNYRFNNNNVDLNRNWGTPDWQATTYWQNNSYPNGGGSSPFSEPETQSLKNLITTEIPRLTITYHSAANLVIGSGISANFASWYANLTGYSLSTSETEDDDSGGCESALGYCITGTMEEWLSLQNKVAIVVEFATATSSEYSRNLPTLKGLSNYPL